MLLARPLKALLVNYPEGIGDLLKGFKKRNKRDCSYFKRLALMAVWKIDLRGDRKVI